jgi:hypothetical protein
MALVATSLFLSWQAQSMAAGRLPPPVGHGIELGASEVGPIAAGLSPISQHPGGEIRDGHTYPFARRVAGTASYDGFRVEGPHLLIERVVFTSPVDIYTRQPVVLRGVILRIASAAHWALHTRPDAGPVYVLWSAAGAATTAGAPADRTNALDRALYLRSDDVTVYRSHLTRTADGIQIHARGARIIETLIDGLTRWDGDHNDGIQMLGRGGDVAILRSRIVNANTQTSCLLLMPTGVRVENSYLSGGGWTVYAGAQMKGFKPGSSRNMVFRGTILGREHFPKGGHFGVLTGWDTTGHGNRWSGNRFTDGTPIAISEPPPPGRREHSR